MVVAQLAQLVTPLSGMCAFVWESTHHHHHHHHHQQQQNYRCPFYSTSKLRV
jgi:hypothetical protein